MIALKDADRLSGRGLAAAAACFVSLKMGLQDTAREADREAEQGGKKKTGREEPGKQAGVQMCMEVTVLHHSVASRQLLIVSVSPDLHDCVELLVGPDVAAVRTVQPAP